MTLTLRDDGALPVQDGNEFRSEAAVYLYHVPHQRAPADVDDGRCHDRAAGGRVHAEHVEDAAPRAQPAGAADGPVARQQAAADVGERPQVVGNAAAQARPGEDVEAALPLRRPAGSRPAAWQFRQRRVVTSPLTWLYTTSRFFPLPPTQNQSMPLPPYRLS